MKPSLTFHNRHSPQAVKEDLLDVCAALGLKVSRSASLHDVRRVMRERLVELNQAGILPPDGLEKPDREAQHQALDRLLASYLVEKGGALSQVEALSLLEWSHARQL